MKKMMTATRKTVSSRSKQQMPTLPAPEFISLGVGKTPPSKTTYLQSKKNSNTSNN